MTIPASFLTRERLDIAAKRLFTAPCYPPPVKPEPEQSEEDMVLWDAVLDITGTPHMRGVPPRIKLAPVPEDSLMWIIQDAFATCYNDYNVRQMASNERAMAVYHLTLLHLRAPSACSTRELEREYQKTYEFAQNNGSTRTGTSHVFPNQQMEPLVWAMYLLLIHRPDHMCKFTPYHQNPNRFYQQNGANLLPIVPTYTDTEQIHKRICHLGGTTNDSHQNQKRCHLLRLLTGRLPPVIWPG